VFDAELRGDQDRRAGRREADQVGAPRDHRQHDREEHRRELHGELEATQPAI
jgi:hypothetical protein